MLHKGDPSVEALTPDRTLTELEHVRPMYAIDMPRFDSILVATDFSTDGNNALRRAALLAEQHAARLTILHVVNPAGSRALRRWFPPTIDIELKTVQTRATLRRFAKEIIARHGIAAKFDVVAGDAFEEILSHSMRADLVVIGQRGTTASLKHLVMGSTTERLPRLSRKPVLVVKRGNHAPYRQVLVPTAFTDRCAAALSAAACLARNAAIHVLHARPSQDEFEMQMADVPSTVVDEYREMKLGEGRARVHEMIAKAGIRAGRAFACVAQGNPSTLALEQEKLLRADLIVAGKHGHSAMADFLLGSVSRRLLAGSSCDVLIIPSTAVDSLGAGTAVTHSEVERQSGVVERAPQTVPIKAQSAAIAGAMESICNAEWRRLRGTSGHVGLPFNLSAQGFMEERAATAATRSSQAGAPTAAFRPRDGAQRGLAW
jgi:nucleotide-binding universal stress UspA family protein